jgi:hypothetical protein
MLQDSVTVARSFGKIASQQVSKKISFFNSDLSKDSADLVDFYCELHEILNFNLRIK